MFQSRYSNFLTILLLIAIIIIIAIVSVLVIKIYNSKKEDQERKNAVIQFDEEINKEDTNKVTEKDDYSSENFIFNENEIVSNQGEENATRDVQYYKDFVMIGKLEIPDINLALPVLERETVASLEKSVAVRYPSNPVLNTKGNIVIAGHNFRNGMLFSNLHLLSVGAKIYITDLEGTKLTYTIYEVYETTPEDTSYITKNVEDRTEVTLVTCTDDSKARTIICAKAD